MPIHFEHVVIVHPCSGLEWNHVVIIEFHRVEGNFWQLDSHGLNNANNRNIAVMENFLYDTTACKYWRMLKNEKRNSTQASLWELEMTAINSVQLLLDIINEEKRCHDFFVRNICSCSHVLILQKTICISLMCVFPLHICISLIEIIFCLNKEFSLIFLVIYPTYSVLCVLLKGIFTH